MTGVAEGLRVIDLSWGTAGPMTTMLLADHRRRRDPGGAARRRPVRRGRRRAGLAPGQAVGDPRPHRSRRPGGPDAGWRRPPTSWSRASARGWPIAWASATRDLRRFNPGLIYCSITGYGRGTAWPTGPATTPWSRLVAGCSGRREAGTAARCTASLVSMRRRPRGAIVHEAVDAGYADVVDGIHPDRP